MALVKRWMVSTVEEEELEGLGAVPEVENQESIGSQTKRILGNSIVDQILSKNLAILRAHSIRP